MRTSIQNTFHSKIISFKLVFVMLLFSAVSWGQTYYAMSGGNYSQTFTGLSTSYPTNFNGLAVLATGTIPIATKTTTATNEPLAVVLTSTALGYDAIVANSTKMILFTQGGASTDNTFAVACDLNLNFTGRTAGSLSFNYANILNSSTASPNGRAASLIAYYSIDGSVWTLLGGPYTVYNNTGASTANVPVSITLPIALNNQPTVKLRFYEYNGGVIVGTPTGSRPKISLDDISVTSTSSVSTPTITLTPTTLTGFTYVVGSGPSTEQTFNASGTNLTAHISIAPPTDYEISTGTGGSFVVTNPITLTHSSGTVSPTPIYVRLKSGLSVASYSSETIAATSTGATGQNVSCSGSVIANVPEINIKQGTTNYLTTSTYAFGNVVQGANSPVTFTIENLGSANLTITSSTIGGAGFSITTNPVSPVSVSGTTTFGITFTPTGIAAFSGSVTIANNDSNESSYVINFTGAGVPNNASDVSFNNTSGASINTNIAYTSYQSSTIANTGNGTNGSIGVMGFYVRDGGVGLNDADVLATELTGISFSVTNVSNIRSAALFNGNTLIATVPVNGVSPIVFTGLSGSNVTCADNAAAPLALNLRITFNQTVTDNQQMIFTVSDVTANASGSSFAASNGGGATSSNSGNTNRIEVTADRLAFVQQPTTTSINTVMAPPVTVSAEDIYGNRDLDFATAVSITSSGTLTGTVLDTAISGLATFSNLTHTAIGTLFNLTATSTGLAFSNTKVSSTFDITSIVYVNGDYQTTADGNWHSTTSSGSSSTWQQRISGNWTAITNSPPANTTNTVYIKNSITLIGTNTASNIIIETGGILNTSTITPTFVNILVKSGGVFKQDGYVKITGTIEVEDGGTFQFNSKNTSSRTTTVWSGTEKFHPDSTFLITNGDTTGNYLPFETEGEISIFTNPTTGYSACFGNVIIDNSGGSNLQLLPTPFTKNLTHRNLIFRSNASNKVFCSGGFTTEIGGDLIIEITYNQTLSIITSANTFNLKVKGNLINNSAKIIRLVNNSAGTANVTVEGDIQLNNTGFLDMNFTNGGVSTLNLKGDLFVDTEALLFATASTISNNSFNFIGNGLTPPTTQTIDVASTSSTENSKLNFNIKSGAYVQLANRNFELGANSKLTVEDGGVLDFGFNVTTPLIVTKSGIQSGTAFESKSGSTLKISSPDGINNTSGTVGNVQITTAPIYSQTATFWYNGKTNQVIGTGLSNGSSAKIVYVNLIDNTKTLTLTNKIGISSAATLDALGGKLEIQKGTVIGSTNLDFYGTGRLVMSDGEYKISTVTTNPSTDYLPQLSNYAYYSLTGGTVNLNGTSATENQILSGTPTYYNLAFNGSNILGTNYKGLSSATNVTNAITINETAVVDVKSFSLGGSPNTPSFTMTGTSSYITDGGGTKPDAGGTYALGATTTIEFANSSGAGIVRLGANYANIIVSGNNVSNISAVTGIKFQTGGTFTVKNTGNFKFKNTAGFTGSTTTAINNSNSPTVTLDLNSTVEYAGANQTVTNFAPYYRNVTISGTGTKTNTTTTFINEDLNVNGSKLLVNTNDVITVKQAVKIATVVTTEAAEIEIKNNGQLIQIDEGDANSGTNFKVNRIATINKFDYVYWSSPVDNFNVSSITGSYKYSWNPIFNNSNGTQGNWTTASGPMTKGKGYIVSALNSSPVRPNPAIALPISFLGKPNNGSFDFEIKRGTNNLAEYDAEPSNPNNELTTEYDDNWNLIGNPYPSAIDAEDFLVLNSSKIEGAVWIWKHGIAPNSSTDPFYQNYSTNYSSSDYLKYNGLGSSEPDTFNGKIASGQGFMVNMLESAGSTNTISFQNSLRAATHSNSNFYRNGTAPEEKSRIWLNIVNTTSGKANTTLVGYSTNSTLGEDHLYDCVFIPEGELAIYSLLNTNPFVIQGRGLFFNSNDTVPLGMKIMANGNYKISINTVDGLFESTSIGIYLEDKLLNSVHDLRQSPYTFTANIGRIDDRFFLRYSDQALETPTFEAVANAVLVANKNNQINIQSSIESIESVIVYDVLGRSLLEKSNIKNNTFIINNLTLSNQTLIVKIVLENGQIVTKKIVF